MDVDLYQSGNASLPYACIRDGDIDAKTKEFVVVPCLMKNAPAGEAARSAEADAGADE